MIDDWIIRVYYYIQRVLTGKKGSKFDQINGDLIDEKLLEIRLNRQLESDIDFIQSQLNKYFGTKGSSIEYDLASRQKRRVPPIYIMSTFNELSTFGKEKEIELNIYFKFITDKHFEIMRVSYINGAIEYTIGKACTRDIELLPEIIENQLKTSLSLSLVKNL
ncbi:TPA: hypothetical protein ACGUTS_004898 [Vibrio vulnificus]